MTAAATTARAGSVSWGVDAPRIRCQLVLADGRVQWSNDFDGDLFL